MQFNDIVTIRLIHYMNVNVCKNMIIFSVAGFPVVTRHISYSVIFYSNLIMGRCRPNNHNTIIN